jgi:multiple sugar transport system permease protein/sn-glycerol 3-phosphate transport system permease protein
MTRPILTLGPLTRMTGELLIVLLCASVALPLLVMLGTAFKPDSEMFLPAPWPERPTLANFSRLFEQIPFGIQLWNSTVSSVLRVLGQVATSVLAAYAFARWTFPGRDYLFLAVIGAMMVPHQLTMVPIYLLIVNLGWYDTVAALIVPNLAAPFGIFLLRQHFLSVPGELYDAAAMDGANSLQALRHVALPLLRPAIGALAIVFFIESWNEYFWPLLVTETAASSTVQMGLRQYIDLETSTDFGPLMAGMLLATLPMLAVFFFFQRQVFETFAQTGLKG